MASRPVTVSASDLIYKNIRLVGFWMTDWYATHSDEERQAMICSICDIARNHSLSIGMQEHRIEAYREALAQATASAIGEEEEFQLRKKHAFIFPSYFCIF